MQWYSESKISMSCWCPAVFTSKIQKHKKACGCLHNFATLRRIPLATNAISEADNANGVFNTQHDESEGRVTRDNLIENCFQ